MLLNAIVLRLIYDEEGDNLGMTAPMLANFTRQTRDQERQVTKLAVPAERELVFEDMFPKEPSPRPKLDEIVKGWDIVGDPSWLLNVAVIGFPKCGTSTLMHHLDSHSEIKMFTEERCDLGGRQEVTLIRDLYNKFEPGNYVRGLKCPSNIDSAHMALPTFKNFFPKAHLIVGVRHPVLWYESFYNCKSQPNHNT